MRFDSPQALERWLIERQMPLNRWGRADAKSVSHLWNELQAGECQLLDGPPLRVVTIATVWVRWEWRCLFEIAQEWADGRTRARQSPPSDKMHRGEPLRDAVLRCLWEELGVPAEDVTILDQPPLVAWWSGNRPATRGCFAVTPATTSPSTSPTCPTCRSAPPNDARAQRSGPLPRLGLAALRPQRTRPASPL